MSNADQIHTDLLDVVCGIADDARRQLHRAIGSLILLLLLSSVYGCGEKQASSDEASVERNPTDTLIVPLRAETMRVFLSAGSTSVIEFGGKRCLPCQEMRGILKTLALRRPDIRIGIVFWEDTPELFAEWEVTLIPAQIIFDAQGREVARHRGVWELKDMLAHIPANSEEPENESLTY
ncbi:thioredoxin family protein [bacterium]|nr:thioredoxin family protein [bacterium]